MSDMRGVIIPKSDQLNSDDLIGGPRTITITDVTIRPGTEQPVSIGFDGDGGKPWKPCKSMSRVLVSMWGPDAKAYTGRSLTLYRDPDVTWAGMKVGGIRISHMSHIERDHTMALTVTKQSRKPFTVKTLAPAPPASAPGRATATSPVPDSPETPSAADEAQKASKRQVTLEETEAAIQAADVTKLAEIDMWLRGKGASSFGVSQHEHLQALMKCRLDELQDAPADHHEQFARLDDPKPEAEGQERMLP